jgi:HSP20 family protein
MDQIRWRNGLADPFQEFETLQEEINRLFNVARVPEPRGIFERAYSPAVDVMENPDGFEVLCDVPGIEIKDIEISIAGSVLTLKGEKKSGEGKGGNGADRYRGETWEGRFQRTLQLPVAVDPDRVEAVLKDGVLRITLPKHQEVKPRQISVKAR